MGKQKERGGLGYPLKNFIDTLERVRRRLNTSLNSLIDIVLRDAMKSSIDGSSYTRDRSRREIFSFNGNHTHTHTLRRRRRGDSSLSSSLPPSTSQKNG